MKVTQSDLEIALTRCKDAFIWAAIFSMVINILQLVPTIYMLQLYDRVVPTGNRSILLMSTLIRKMANSNNLMRIILC
jgi:ATP-binding cassette subfamily C protein EexD